MGWEEILTDLRKNIVDLEVQCEHLKEKKTGLEEEIREVKGMEEKSNGKHKKWKDRYKQLMEKLEIEAEKWTKERCMQLEVEKRKLEIDLNAALERIEDGRKEVADKHRDEVECLKRLLDESHRSILMLCGKNEFLEAKIATETDKWKGEKSKLEFDLKAADEGREEVRVEVERVTMLLEESESRITTVLAKLASLEKQNSRLEMDFQDKLDREKRTLEAEIRKKDEKITKLVQEKEQLAAKKMKIETSSRVVKLEGAVKSQQQVHGTRKVPILATLTPPIQGPKSCEESVSEEVRRKLGSRTRSRKVETPGSCSVENQTNSKSCKSDVVSEHNLVWKSPQDMFNAFTTNDELCMRSVCALYRKHKSLGDDCKDPLISSSCTRGFMQSYESRGMALGKLLTSRDSQGRLKTSLAEFEQADPSGREDCRLIAKDHPLVLYEIYKNNLDSLFEPAVEAFIN